MKPNNFAFYILSASGKPGKGLGRGQNPFMPNKPNFKKSELNITHDKIKT